ncbi:MAG: helicase-associated domain-containing protein [Chloroflexi bacterium]|nr:helicase-associated domain-containing protein [Chloroflexota bacterium]
MSTSSRPTDSSGAAARPLWPVALQFRPTELSLAETVDAEFNAAQLRELARWLNVQLQGSSKIGFMQQVVTALHERVERMSLDAESVLEGLSAEQQDFLRRAFTARDHEMHVPRSLLASVWARQFDRDGDRKLSEMLTGLRKRALIFPTSPVQFGLRDVYYRWLSLGPNVPVVAFKVESPRPLPPEGAGERGAFLDDFEALLDVLMKSGAVARGPLPPHPQATRFQWLRDWEHDADDAQRVLVSRPGWVPDPQTGIGVPLFSPLTPQSTAMLEDQTGLTASRLALHVALACALQMIDAPARDASGPRQMTARVRRIEEWLVLGPEQKLRRAWRAWLEEVADPFEVRAVAESARPGESFVMQRAIGARDLTPGHLAAEWCALRRYMARVMRGLPIGAWLSWDDLRAQLFDFLPECAWAMTDRADWWFVQAGSRARLQMARREDWNQTLGAVFEHIVGDGMANFGAVEVQRVDGCLRAFRVTELGAWLLCETMHQPPESLSGRRSEAEPIAWNREAMTLYLQPAPDRADIIALMRRIADRGATSFTYVITPVSIERALSDGMTLDEVSRRFKRAGVSLPRPVSDLFRIASRRFGRVRVYQSLTVLELADEMTARELAANTSLMRYVVYRISPHAFVLPDDVIDDLIDEMQSKGYTPRMR